MFFFNFFLQYFAAPFIYNYNLKVLIDMPFLTKIENVSAI